MKLRFTAAVSGSSAIALGGGAYVAGDAIVGPFGAIELTALGVALSGVALVLTAFSARVPLAVRLAMCALAVLVGAIVAGTDHFHYSADIHLEAHAPNLLGSVAVLLAGVALTLAQFALGRRLLRVALALAALLFCAGLFALYLRITDIGALLKDELRILLELDLASTLGVLFLSIGIGAILMGTPEAHRYWREREDRAIAAISAVAVGVIVIGAALAGAAVFMRHSFHVFSHTLESGAAANAAIVEGLLDGARQHALEVAGIARGVVAFDAGEPVGTLERLASNPELGIRSLRASGEPRPFVSPRPLRVPLKKPERSALLWDGEWLLETHVAGTDRHQRFQDMVMEVHIAGLDQLMGSTDRLGRTGALVICASRTEALLDCFPSVLNPLPSEVPAADPASAPPIAGARSGASAVVMSRDYYGRSVIAAVRPIGDTGLLISQKVSAAELFEPVRQHFWGVGWLVLGLLMTSLLLVPRLVQPLVNRLVEARARLHAVLDSIPDAVVTADANGRILSANRAAEQAFGYAADELQDIPVASLIQRTGPNGDDVALDRLQQSAQTRGAAEQVTGRRRDGSGFPAGLRVAPFELKRQSLFVGVIRDNTEKQRAMQALAASREMFRALVENLPDVVIRFDSQLRCIYASPALHSQFGVPPDAVYGATRMQLSELARLPRSAFAPLSDVVAGAGEATSEFAVARNGEVRYYHTRFVPEYGAQGEAKCVLCVARDVTPVRQAELQLHKVIAHNANALERERKQIAREVHDELGQVLTAIKTELNLMRLKSDDAQLHDTIGSVNALADRAIQTVRDVVRALRPSTLDLGLVYALQWLCRDFQQRTRVPCRLETPDEEDVMLDDSVATHLFRIVQESLTNIERHAHAAAVRIVLAVHDGEVHLDIIDDGRGFDPERPDGGHFGLVGIKERAAMIGGYAQISSEPGKGTRIHVQLAPPQTGEQTS